MADEQGAAQTDEAENAEDGEEKKKGLPLILIIGLAGVVLLLAGAGAFLFLGGGEEPVAEEVADAEGAGDGEKTGMGEGDGGEYADPDEAAYGSADNVVFYRLPDLLVNVRSDNGPPAYLKLALTLELSDPADIEAVEYVMPRVMDRFQSFLRELRLSDLSGSAGSYRLRSELLRRVNLAVAPVKVRAVLIEEMLVQ